MPQTGDVHQSDRVIGVDGCRGGWLGAVVEDGQRVEWLLLPYAAAVFALAAVVIGIDMPIGLPDQGRRDCDWAARKRLGPAQNAVFLTPVRGVLEGRVLDGWDYPAVNELSRRLTGFGLSKQTWNILDRIGDVDAALGDAPDPRVVEVHPEVSFRVLDDRVVAGKKTAVGVGQRIRALAGWIDVGGALAEVPLGPGLDDALDALVAAWSARNWLRGNAVVLPGDDPPRDGRGRPMRIVA